MSFFVYYSFFKKELMMDFQPLVWTQPPLNIRTIGLKSRDSKIFATSCGIL
jgi:hypothetical protein